MPPPASIPIAAGLRASGVAAVVNLLLAGGKILAGILGHSYALVADGIESIADIFSSLVVWGGLRISARPADANHPFGHGKAESIAALLVSFTLLGAALLIAAQSIREIRTPHHAPAPFTLLVLVGVILIKEGLFRLVFRVGRHLESAALKSDAWHHRSDALTSAAAFVGIGIALVGGPGFEAADDWAALVACAVIAANGLRLLRGALDEVMDASVSPETAAFIRAIAADVEGVAGIEKCRIRKHGLHLAMDIHVRVDGDLTVRRGHEIGHAVKDRLLASQHRINDVTVHIEPSPPAAPIPPGLDPARVIKESFNQGQ
ncbi:MAG TPA: cation diffusion facilitator family transporter [Methylomirabilota bacterium]|nr:cation diffusion facilitator family transporter [Methylomirabilota bacterium]